VGISAAAAAWLTKALVTHELSKDLERRKTELNERLEREKARWEGDVKQQVETILGDRAADREYTLDARKRLYAAIGPLRFQLLMACRDFSGRILSHANHGYDTSLGGYYGRSFLYRILRPLTLSQLIEQQVAFADFSVDAGAGDLLRFKKAAFACLTGGTLVSGHPRTNWRREEEHVFHDHLARAADAMIVTHPDKDGQCMRYSEFEQLLQTPEGLAAVVPFPTLLEQFSPQSKPLLWLRLVAYAYLCNEFINQVGGAIGFEARTLEPDPLLLVSTDKEISGALADYVSRCKAMVKSTL